MQKHKVYLSLGTNLGDKVRNLNVAIHELETLVGAVVRQSAFLPTSPWGFESANGFLNCCVLCCTENSPREVLELTQQIERNMGRRHKSVNGNYSDRIIDIDILLYDNLKVEEPDLKIPHPLMQERDFVMIPLEEILEK